jgi:hypothetical protein
MKKFTNLLIVASLALAGAVMAQQPTPDESQPPGKKQSEKKPPMDVKPRPTRPPKPEAPAVKEPTATKPEAPAVKEPAAPKPEAPAVKEPAAPKSEAPRVKEPKPDKKAPKPAPSAAPEMKASGELPAASATPAPKKEQSKKELKKAPAADTAASPSASPAAAKATPSPAAAKTTPAASIAPKASATPAAAVSATPATAASASPAATAAASAAPSVAQTSPATAPTVNPVAAAKKPDPAKVEQIKTQHQNFKAQPRPDRVPPVTFNASFRIQGSDRWQGPQYEVYRSYRPERHDRGWYHSRYQRVELIAGGYYYFNNGFWAPAWGYSPTEEYYAYDAPIYVGKHAEPPDKVIADVQAVLQEMGYYNGEVDGLIGPITRDALTRYQNDQGLTATAVIDEPTLDSLGMG